MYIYIIVLYVNVYTYTHERLRLPATCIIFVSCASKTLDKKQKGFTTSQFKQPDHTDPFACRKRWRYTV